MDIDHTLSDVVSIEVRTGVVVKGWIIIPFEFVSTYRGSVKIQTLIEETFRLLDGVRTCLRGSDFMWIIRTVDVCRKIGNKVRIDHLFETLNCQVSLVRVETTCGGFCRRDDWVILNVTQPYLSLGHRMRVCRIDVDGQLVEQVIELDPQNIHSTLVRRNGVVVGSGRLRCFGGSDPVYRFNEIFETIKFPHRMQVTTYFEFIRFTRDVLIGWVSSRVQ